MWMLLAVPMLGLGIYVGVHALLCWAGGLKDIAVAFALPALALVAGALAIARYL